VTDLDVPIALNRDDITKARATVEKLAAAELSEIPDDPSDLVAESTPRGAAEPAAIN
jgi:predicted MarR family transcription regulator